MSTTPAFDALDYAHQRFVDRVLLGDTKTDAYASAYPDATRESASSAGARLFGNVRIQAALAERKAQLAERTKVTPQRLVEELASVAFARMSTFVSWGPGGSTVVDDTMLSGPDMAAVAEIAESEGKFPTSAPRLRVKLHAKQPAIDKLIELFDVTPERIRQLYPQLDLASPEAIEGVFDILKEAKARRAEVEGTSKRKAGDS